MWFATWQGPRPAFQAEEVVRAPQDGQPLLVVGQLEGPGGVWQVQHLQPPHSACQMPKQCSFLPTSVYPGFTILLLASNQLWSRSCLQELSSREALVQGQEAGQLLRQRIGIRPGLGGSSAVPGPAVPDQGGILDMEVGGKPVRGLQFLQQLLCRRAAQGPALNLQCHANTLHGPRD